MEEAEDDVEGQRGLPEVVHDPGRPPPDASVPRPGRDVALVVRAAALVAAVHRNPALRPRDRRENVLVVADPSRDNVSFMRLSNAECIARREEQLQRIADNDPDFPVAKFFHLSLGTEGAARLRQALQTNRTLERLFLTGNRLGPEGCRSLCKGIAGHPLLTKLDLQCNNLGPAGALYLSEALMTNATLTDLNLAGNRLGDKGCEALCNALIFSRQSRIKVLNLSHNALVGSGFHLSKLIRQNRNLRELLLWRNRLGSRSRETGQSSFRFLAEALPAAKGLQLLDVTFNNVQTPDCVHLLEAAAAHPPHDGRPLVLRIVEGNVIATSCFPPLARHFALYRMPLLAMGEAPDQPGTEPEDEDAVVLTQTVTIDKADVRRGVTQLALELDRQHDARVWEEPIPAGKRVASRTVEWTGTAYNRRQGVTGDVVVVVDRSPSLAPAWEAVLAYLRRRVLGTDLAGGSRMGLVAFDGAAAVVTDLTADRQALMAGINALAVGDGGPTHLAAALDAGVAAFGDSEPRRARFLEVLTDRLGDDGRWARPPGTLAWVLVRQDTPCLREK
eukprot:EG_transcript_6059